MFQEVRHNRLKKLIANFDAYLNQLHEKDKNGRNILMIALQKNYISLAKMILEHECDLTHIDETGSSVLHYACSKETDTFAVEIINRLSNLNSYNFDIKNKKGWTALCNACKDGAINAAKLLINKGCSLNEKTSKGYTPLYYAISNNYSDILSLVDIDTISIDPNFVDYNENTLLMVAGSCLENDVIFEKIASFGNTDFVNSKGKSVLDSIKHKVYNQRLINVIDINKILMDKKTDVINILSFYASNSSGFINILENINQQTINHIRSIDTDFKILKAALNFDSIKKIGAKMMIDIIYPPEDNEIIYPFIDIVIENNNKDVLKFIIDKMQMGIKSYGEINESNIDKLLEVVSNDTKVAIYSNYFDEANIIIKNKMFHHALKMEDIGQNKGLEIILDKGYIPSDIYNSLSFLINAPYFIRLLDNIISKNIVLDDSKFIQIVSYAVSNYTDNFTNSYIISNLIKIVRSDMCTKDVIKIIKENQTVLSSIIMRDQEMCSYMDVDTDTLFNVIMSNSRDRAIEMFPNVKNSLKPGTLCDYLKNCDSSSLKDFPEGIFNMYSDNIIMNFIEKYDEDAVLFHLIYLDPARLNARILNYASKFKKWEICKYIINNITFSNLENESIELYNLVLNETWGDYIDILLAYPQKLNFYCNTVSDLKYTVPYHACYHKNTDLALKLLEIPECAKYKEGFKNINNNSGDTSLIGICIKNNLDNVIARLLEIDYNFNKNIDYKLSDEHFVQVFTGLKSGKDKLDFTIRQKRTEFLADIDADFDVVVKNVKKNAELKKLVSDESKKMESTLCFTCGEEGKVYVNTYECFHIFGLCDECYKSISRSGKCPLCRNGLKLVKGYACGVSF